MGQDGREAESSTESPEPLAIPSDYVASYERARAVDPERATNYIVHTMVADPATARHNARDCMTFGDRGYVALCVPGSQHLGYTVNSAGAY